MNEETRHGRPYRLRLGDPLPDEVPLLPTPAEMAVAFPHLAMPWVDPLTGERHEPMPADPGDVRVGHPEIDVNGLTVVSDPYLWREVDGHVDAPVTPGAVNLPLTGGQHGHVDAAEADSASGRANRQPVNVDSVELETPLVFIDVQCPGCGNASDAEWINRAGWCRSCAVRPVVQ